MTTKSRLPGVLALAAALLSWGPAAGAEETSAQKLERGIALHDSGRYDEAIAIYREVLRKDPKDAAALHELGLSLEKAGNPAECVRVAEQALEFVELHRAELHTLAGTCYDELGEPLKAVAAYTRGLEEFPSDSTLAFNRALTEVKKLQHFREARGLLETSLAGRPGHAPSYYLLAIAYVPDGYVVHALLAALRFLSLAPDGGLAPSTARLARALLDAGATGPDQGKTGLEVGSLPKDQGDFTAVAATLALLSASRFEKSRGKSTDLENLAMQVAGLLGALARHQESPARAEGFVADRLVLPLVEVHRAGLGETFAYLAFSSLELEGGAAWLAAHPGERAALEKILHAGG